MNRHEWKFKFESKKVAEAAQNKLAFHKGRLAYWEKKKAEVLERISQTGVKVTDSLASDISNYKGGLTPSISIDPELQKHLTEAHQKIQSHYGNVNEYETWVEVLNGNTSSELELDHQDYLFFFGQ